MRDMIIEKEKGPTQEDLLREREKFAKQVSALERRIEQLQEENEKLQSVRNRIFDTYNVQGVSRPRTEVISTTKIIEKLLKK